MTGLSATEGGMELTVRDVNSVGEGEIGSWGVVLATFRETPNAPPANASPAMAPIILYERVIRETLSYRNPPYYTLFTFDFN